MSEQRFTVIGYIEEHDPETGDYQPHEPQEVLGRFGTEDDARAELNRLQTAAAGVLADVAQAGGWPTFEALQASVDPAPDAALATGQRIAAEVCEGAATVALSEAALATLLAVAVRRGATASEPALKPYTLIAAFLDHPSAVAEVVVQHVRAGRPQDADVVKDEDRPWTIVAVFEGHITPAFVERLL